VDFEEALRRNGFRAEREARGVTHWAARPGEYLTYWVQADQDGTALFTWEYAIGEFAAGHGLQVGSDERLNTFLYPMDDVRGAQDPAWLAACIERTEALLRSLSFL
jgi:hypothetical protein